MHTAKVLNAWPGHTLLNGSQFSFNTLPTKEAAFLVRIFHVFLWTCYKLEHWCYKEGWLKRTCKCKEGL